MPKLGPGDSQSSLQRYDELPASQRFEGKSDQRPKQPRAVLLTFCCDEEGQQHADALFDTLQTQHQDLEVMNGCELFGLKQLTTVQLHGGVVLACMAAWQAYRSNNAKDSLPIYAEVQKFQTYEAKFAWWISIHAKTAAEGCNFYVNPSRQQLSEIYSNRLLFHVWPENPINSWAAADVHLIQLSDHEDKPEFSPSSNPTALIQAFVVSRSEPGNTLPGFLSGIISRTDCGTLQKVFPSIDSGGAWQRATLAAFLVQDQQTLASLDKLVQISTVELLVNLVFNCNTIRYVGQDRDMAIWRQGPRSECSFGIQLLASTPRQASGLRTQSSWTIAMDQEDRETAVTAQSLLARAAEGLQAAMEWSDCKIHSMSVTNTEEKTYKQELFESGNGALSSGDGLYDAICVILNQLAASEDLLVFGVDAQGTIPERALVEFEAKVTLASRPSEAPADAQAMPGLLEGMAPKLVNDVGISDGQKQIAERILDRVFILTNTAAVFHERAEVWREASKELLRKKFPKGIEFRILTPRFNTLSRQTMQRVLSAGLATEGEPDKVIQYSDRHNHKKQWASYRQQVLDEPDRLFLTVADECHWGPAATKAHDKMVNDYSADNDSSQATLLDRENYLILLVSATPYNVMSISSHLPKEYMVVKLLPDVNRVLSGSKLYDVMQVRGGVWQVASGRPHGDSYRNSCSSKTVSISPQEMEGLKSKGAVEELHIVDWFCKNQRHPAVNGYRRLDTYLESTLRQQGHQITTRTGLVQDQVFTGLASRKNMASTGSDNDAAQSKDRTFTDDQVLVCSYLITLQFFRTFRWDGAGLLPANSPECLRRVQDVQGAHHEFILELEDFEKKHISVGGLITKLLRDMLDGVEGSDTHSKQEVMFSRWLQPHSGVTAGSCDETYGIVESLLTVSYPAQTESISGGTPLWQRSDVDATGSMKVIRVSDVKNGGKLFYNLLKAFLDFTGRPGARGPAWTGLTSNATSSNHFHGVMRWYLFAVIKDFSQDEASKKLEQNIPTWFRRRRLCSSHPSLLAPTEVVTLNDLVHQKGGLLYEDLYGVPCLLILCEKGRMGDTFPHTFDCLDMRLRASENHTTRVQELGRLCRYPRISSDTCILPIYGSSQLSGPACVSDLQLQLELAFEFASGRRVHVDIQTWHVMAVSLSDAAVDVYAYSTWMTARNQGLARQTVANLKELLKRVQALKLKLTTATGSNMSESAFRQSPLGTQLASTDAEIKRWEEDPAVQAGEQAGRSKKAKAKGEKALKAHIACMSAAVTAWRQDSAQLQVVDEAGVLVCFMDDRPLRVTANTSNSAYLSADVVTPEELLHLIINKCEWTQQTELHLARFERRLPYAVGKVGTKLSSLQRKIWEQQIDQPGHDGLLSYVDNMIVPTSLDAYLSPVRKLSGTNFVDFRNNYKAKQSRNRDRETVSYDSRKHQLHPRRLLLSAECQIGKTGVYLALLQDLKDILSPEPEVYVDVVLPDLDNAPPHSTADESEVPHNDQKLAVDYDKWCSSHPDFMRWRAPYYPDVSVWNGTVGQDMPKYAALNMGKYGQKVLLERFVRLVLSIKFGKSGWLKAYIAATRKLGGEMPLCKEAQHKLDVLLESHSATDPPLQLGPQGLHAVLSQSLLVDVLDWDLRLRPCVNEFLQRKVLHTRGQERLKVVPGRSRATSGLQMSPDLQSQVNIAAAPEQLDILQTLCWGEQGTSDVLPGDTMTTSSRHAYLAFQPRLMQALPVKAPFSRLQKRFLDPSLQDRIQVSGLFWPGVQFHLSHSHEEALQYWGLLDLSSNNYVTRAWSLPWCEGNKHVVQHWIFTPSFNRANGARQAFLDWQKAMAPEAEYVRVLVIRQAELAQYSTEVAALNSKCKPLQQTMIMTLPQSLSLQQLKGLSPAYRAATASCVMNDSLGVGYARLCIQLVAAALQLKHVWMLDDNVQDCWQLDLRAKSLHRPPAGQKHEHGPLLACTFDAVMRGIEHQVSRIVDKSGLPDNALVRTWNPQISPRDAQTPISSNCSVKSWFHYSGSHNHYAIIGPSRQPYRYKLVGATWPGGAGPPPFKITHSVYSFFLLNIAATTDPSKPLVLWPAKQYAEDVEFNHMCEDSKLAVVKCNRFFFHKANLQGAELRKALQHPRVQIKPTVGPMWGQQVLDVHVEPQQHQTKLTSMTICGCSVDCTQTPVLSPALPFDTAFAISSTSGMVMTGSIEVYSGATQLTAWQQYSYHGLFKWTPGTTVDNKLPDEDAEQAKDAAGHWRCQYKYLTGSTHWLPTIGVTAHAKCLVWSKYTPDAMLGMKCCLLILDKPQLVLSLRTLQGCVEQHACNKSSKTERTCVLFGKVADLHQQLSVHGSAEALCQHHGLHLVAVYSTNKPNVDRHQLPYVPCQPLLHTRKHLEEGPYFALHLQLTGSLTGLPQWNRKSKRTSISKRQPNLVPYA